MKRILIVNIQINVEQIATFSKCERFTKHERGRLCEIDEFWGGAQIVQRLQGAMGPGNVLKMFVPA